MSNLTFSLIAFLGSFFAGILGAITGLGGGVIITPLLLFFLDVDIHYAMGASLIAVVATSLGSSSFYIKSGYTNMHLALFLATATTLGALFGAAATSHIEEHNLYLIFAAVLLFSVIYTYFQKEHKEVVSSKAAIALKLEGTLPARGKYGVTHVGAGWCIMAIAGFFSGLLGIGSGAFKVLALDSIMKVPLKASTTTSNFMIGLTATASTGIFLSKGLILTSLVTPVVLGVLFGAMFGAFLLPKLKIPLLRNLFSILVVGIAIGMVVKWFTS